MVERDLFLSAFWLALFAGSLSAGLVLLWLYRAVRDIVALMFGLMSLWLAVAFVVNLYIRFVSPSGDCQLTLIAFQRSAYAVAVLSLMAGADALVRSHNGQVPRIRRFMHWWEKQR